MAERLFYVPLQGCSRPPTLLQQGNVELNDKQEPAGRPASVISCPVFNQRQRVRVSPKRRPQLFHPYTRHTPPPSCLVEGLATHSENSGD